MKKALTILILLIPFISIGQKVSLAPAIGLNIIPMAGSDIGQNYQFGYHIGGHLKYHFSDKFKLNTGIFLTQKKKEYSSTTTSPAFTIFDDLLNGLGGFGGAGSSDLDSILNTPECFKQMFT